MNVRSNNVVFIVVVIIVACTAGMSSDIYAPSIPAIAQDLNSAIDRIQATMVVFMFGLAFSQLCYGPITDVWGRKKPLLLGTAIFIVGNLLALCASDVSMLTAARLVQGIGAGASASIWRSMFRDKYSGAEMAKYGGYLAIAITFIVPAAPLIGGYLQEFFSWRATFNFMVVYAAIGAIMTMVLMPESHDRASAHKFSLVTILTNYLTLVTNRIFIGYTLCSFLAYGAFFSWFVVGPVIVIHHLGYAPNFFGWLTLVGGGGATALSGYVNGKLVKRWGSENMLKFGWSLMLMAGSLLLSGWYIFGVDLLAIFIPIVLFYFGVCLIFPNSFAQAFAPFGHMAGTAAAVYGCLQTVGAVVAGSIVTYLSDANQVPLAIVIMAAPILSYAVYSVLNLGR